jgi:hypothetical protein
MGPPLQAVAAFSGPFWPAAVRYWGYNSPTLTEGLAVKPWLGSFPRRGLSIQENSGDPNGRRFWSRIGRFLTCYKGRRPVTRRLYCFPGSLKEASKRLPIGRGLKRSVETNPTTEYDERAALGTPPSPCSHFSQLASDSGRQMANRVGAWQHWRGVLVSMDQSR